LKWRYHQAGCGRTAFDERNATEAVHIRDMVRIPLFRDVTPCHWAIVPDVSRRGGLILKRRNVQELDTSDNWRWGHYALSKRRERISQWRGVKSGKNETSNSQERCI
jgi:hypothetical protein